MVPEELKDKTVCVVGLGYVGQPLAEAFSKHVNTIGFDIDLKKVERINGYNEGNKGLKCVSDASYIGQADFILICVPTPVTKYKDPDLSPVICAARIVGKNLKEGAIVVLESTVYPGVTEEIVVPILEQESGMICGQGFKVGYSPERVNPGDCSHTIDKIKKIVSGMDLDSIRQLTSLYGLITHVYATKDIKTAEAAKVIENIQRDINIALMNELAIIFYKLGLDTEAVLEAAGTKWNFIKFNPGLVGGHCIPVDPYYLVYKSREIGYHPQVILAGRSINDSMPKYIAELAIKGLNEVGKVIKGSKIVIMGLTYKENVPDIRESPAREIINELNEFGADIYGYDPLLTEEHIKAFGIKPLTKLNLKMDCTVITVAHGAFKELRLEDLISFMNSKPVLIDIRGIFNKEDAKIKGIYYKRI